MTKNQAKILLLQRVKYDPTSPSGLTDLNGSPVGTLNHDGYWLIASKRWLFTVHILIWEMHRGPVPKGHEIDHQTGKHNDINNLRIATRAQNMANVGIIGSNTSGVKGMSYSKSGNDWRGQVTHQGVHHRFRHKDPAVVEQWLIDTRNKLHGAFARHK